MRRRRRVPPANGPPTLPGRRRSSPARRSSSPMCRSTRRTGRPRTTEDPFAVPLGEKADLLVAPDRHDPGGRRRAPGPSQPHVLGHQQVVRVQPGPSHQPAHRRVRRRHERDRGRRDRDPGAVLPAVVRPVRDRRLRGRFAASTCRPTRPASARRPSRCSTAPECPADHHRTSSSRAASSRCRSTSRSVTPSSSTASSAGRRRTRGRRSSSCPSLDRCATAAS